LSGFYFQSKWLNEFVKQFKTFSDLTQGRNRPDSLSTEAAMPNPYRYFIEEREDGYAVKGQGKARAALVGLTESQAEKEAHHFSGRGGVVECKALDGQFEHCECSRCKNNRRK
jgi:hypothetical protein